MATVEQTAPEPRTATAVVLCSKCDLSFPIGTERCSTCKRLLPGNQIRLTHGLSGLMKNEEQALEEFVGTTAYYESEIYQDLGGQENLSTISRGYVQKLATLQVVIDHIAHELARRGITTPKGRVRSLYAAYLQAVSQWDRLAKVLGLERKPKHVSDSIEAWMQREAAK